MKEKTISIACDHGGLELKTFLVENLSKKGFTLTDHGVFNHDSVDYPDYAKLVGGDVLSNKSAFGILVCTSGIGMSMAANKIPGIRAALILNEKAAFLSRMHNHANVICLGQIFTPNEDALKFVEIFAETGEDAGRHERRVQKLCQMDGSGAVA